MYKKKILAIIPARKNSKSLKNKNVKTFKNKPLIYWSIKSALASKHISDVVVSTDCKKIASISMKYGAQVPFLRPKKLADDNTSTIKVLQHAITILRDYDYLIVLQPTSPLRSTKDIDNAIAKLFKKNANSLVSVTKVREHPSLMYTIKKNDLLHKISKFPPTRRQNFTELFLLNGAIYIVKINHFIKHKKLIDLKTTPYIMPFERSFDIDDKLDLILSKNFAQGII